MAEEHEREQVARNEAIFREVNDSIEAGRWPGEEGHAIAFRCECSQLRCTVMIELSHDDYESVRSHPRRFLVAPGHELLEAETVVERRAGYLVVEKRREAGEVAKETDPRS
jgi:hypothetical protein